MIDPPCPASPCPALSFDHLVLPDQPPCRVGAGKSVIATLWGLGSPGGLGERLEGEKANPQAGGLCEEMFNSCLET